MFTECYILVIRGTNEDDGVSFVRLRDVTKIGSKDPVKHNMDQFISAITDDHYFVVWVAGKMESVYYSDLRSLYTELSETSDNEIFNSILYSWGNS